MSSIGWIHGLGLSFSTWPILVESCVGVYVVNGVVLVLLEIVVVVEYVVVNIVVDVIVFVLSHSP